MASRYPRDEERVRAIQGQYVWRSWRDVARTFKARLAVFASLVWWVIGFLTFFVWTGSGIVGVLGGLATWWLTVQVWWRTVCRRCGGTARFYDPGSGADSRPCPACEGRGWVPRIFAVRRK